MNPFNKLTPGIEINQIFYEFQCSLLYLSNCIYLSPVSHILTLVFVVYSYLDHIHLKLKKSQEREIYGQEVRKDDIDFEHDWNNSLYALNVYNISTRLFTMKNDL